MTAERILGALGVAAFENRKIDAETVVRYGVFTGSKNADGEVVPDPRGNIIVFPFMERGREVATKYRGPKKMFWQRAGGRRTFWNSDVLDESALHDGRHALIITEGEIDALTALDCGFPFTVSVPDGAPPVPQGKQPGELEPVDPSREHEGKFEFVWNNRDRLKRIKRFIIAVDNDGPGIRLAEELKRRLTPSRCSFVTYPDGCKDLNDVRTLHGADAVRDVLNQAKPYPVRGLYRLSDYPDAGPLETYPTGWDGMAQKLRVFLGMFIVVSGIPSHGKSTWTVNLVSNLCSTWNWKVAICSPEMPTVPMLRDTVRHMKLGRVPDDLDVADKKRVDEWIDRHFRFIDVDPTGTGDQDEPFDLDWIIERATDAVLRDGIQILVVDPWNEIEHARRREETMSDYVSRAIRELKRFAKLYKVIVIVVAHPTKEVGKDGKQRLVNLYDIENSAAWFNKCDLGIIVERPDKNLTDANIWIQKARYKQLGKLGKLEMVFEEDQGRFRPKKWDEDVSSSLSKEDRNALTGRGLGLV